jgi:LmbE family N-acetylglucosaminyl deacetylase
MHADGRLVAISPYFNDAVVSCGGLLAARPESTVLTVFSGMPLGAGQMTEQDRRSGFKDGRQAVLTRHAQSERALALLGVRGVQMDLLDEQYLDSGDGGRLTGALASALSTLRPRIILMPLGLFHSAHVRVCDAALTIRGLFQRVIWVAYEEASDRGRPGLVQERLATLLRRQIMATPIGIAGNSAPGARKRAVAAHASLACAEGSGGQLPPRDGAPPERYWRLSWQRDKSR